jgi:menaquinone-dependent protoporphyrinogen oxidase
MVTAMRAPLGDFRDWDAVRAWAGEVAVALRDLRR